MPAAREWFGAEQAGIVYTRTGRRFFSDAGMQDALLAHHPRDGVARVVCEEEHMGSRAVAVVCRTPAAARAWVGAEQAGIVFTRTGRRFFSDALKQDALLSRLREAAAAVGLWDELGDWAAFDYKILPWSL